MEFYTENHENIAEWWHVGWNFAVLFCGQWGLGE